MAVTSGLSRLRGNASRHDKTHPDDLQRNGEAPRYPLLFEKEAGAGNA